MQGDHKVVEVTQLHLPHDFTQELPLQPQLWLRKYGITQQEQKLFGIGWSECYNRLILPVYDRERLVYWQGRTFKPITKDNPKYLNIRQQGAKNVFFRRFSPNCRDDGRVLVIVEDILSAIKVGRYSDSLALLGSYLPTSLPPLLEKYDKVFIWLDNDKLSTSIKAMRKLTQITGKPVIIIDTLLDPKEQQDEFIERRLYG